MSKPKMTPECQAELERCGIQVGVKIKPVNPDWQKLQQQKAFKHYIKVVKKKTALKNRIAKFQQEKNKETTSE